MNIQPYALSAGSFLDFDIVADALQGAWGAFVNTDSFTVGEPWEIYAGMRIFELAKKAGVRHYVWSSLESAYKVFQTILSYVRNVSMLT